MSIYGNTSASGNAVTILGNVDSLHVSRHELEISFFKTSAYEQAKDGYENRVKDTCSWFLEHPKYRNWKSARHNELLWLTAGPGFGKSVLLKALVEERLVAQKEDDIILYFFFKDNGDQTPFATALCALLHQLYCCSGGEALFEKHAIPAIKRHGDWLKTNTDALLQLFLKSIQESAVGDVYCILDALDEAHKSAWTEMPRALDQVAKLPPDRGGRSLKCVLTTRSNITIEDALFGLMQDRPERRLLADEELLRISEDIDRVAIAKILALDARRNFTERERLAIQRKVSGPADRTYLWLSLIWPHVESISGLSEDEYVANIAATELPSTLESIYQDMLNQCSDHLKAQPILSLIVASHEGLTITELDTMLAVSAQTCSFHDLKLRGETRLSQEIRRLCGPIVTIVGDKAQLIHHSAKRFLMKSWPPSSCRHSNHYEPPRHGQENTLSYTSCLRDLVTRLALLLGLEDLRPKVLAKSNIKSPFSPKTRQWVEEQRRRLNQLYPGLLYAVDNWLRLSQALANLDAENHESEHTERLRSEIGSISRSALNPTVIVRDARQWWSCAHVRGIIKPGCREPSVATYYDSPVWFGLSLMLDGKVRWAFQDEIDLIRSTTLASAYQDEMLDPWECSLLVIALSGGLVDSMSHCLHHAQRSKRFEVVGNAALRLAAMFSHHELVKVLLQAGVSPNAPGPGGHTAVHLALDPCIHARQNFSRFETLMRYGTLDFTVENGDLLTPLSYVDSPVDLDYIDRVRTANWGRIDQLTGRFRVEVWMLMTLLATAQRISGNMSTSIRYFLFCVECAHILLLVLLCPTALPEFRKQSAAFLNARQKLASSTTPSAWSKFLDRHFGLAELVWKTASKHMLQVIVFLAGLGVALSVRPSAPNGVLIEPHWTTKLDLNLLLSSTQLMLSLSLLVYLPMNHATQRMPTLSVFVVLAAAATPSIFFHTYIYLQRAALLALSCLGTAVTTLSRQHPDPDLQQTVKRSLLWRSPIVPVAIISTLVLRIMSIPALKEAFKRLLHDPILPPLSAFLGFWLWEALHPRADGPASRDFLPGHPYILPEHIRSQRDARASSNIYVHSSTGSAQSSTSTTIHVRTVQLEGRFYKRSAGRQTSDPGGAAG